MKIKDEEGSWMTIPLPICPDCFRKQMRERAYGKPKRALDSNRVNTELR